jgi:outer membrane usher protein FimD/PapC
VDEVSGQKLDPAGVLGRGVTGFIMDYNLYASQYVPSHGDSNQNVNTYGTLGFNLGAWRLRSDYQYDQSFTENNQRQQQQSAANLSVPPYSIPGVETHHGAV